MCRLDNSLSMICEMWSSVNPHNSLYALMISHFSIKLDYEYFKNGFLMFNGVSQLSLTILGTLLFWNKTKINKEMSYYLYIHNIYLYQYHDTKPNSINIDWLLGLTPTFATKISSRIWRSLIKADWASEITVPITDRSLFAYTWQTYIERCI